MAKKERFLTFAWRWFKAIAQGAVWVAVYIGLYWALVGRKPTMDYLVFCLVFVLLVSEIERERKEKEREDGTMYIQVPTELLARTDAHSITMHIQREREGEEDHEDPGRRDPRQLQ